MKFYILKKQIYFLKKIIFVLLFFEVCVRNVHLHHFSRCCCTCERKNERKKAFGPLCIFFFLSGSSGTKALFVVAGFTMDKATECLPTAVWKIDSLTKMPFILQCGRCCGAQADVHQTQTKHSFWNNPYCSHSTFLDFFFSKSHFWPLMPSIHSAVVAQEATASHVAL